MNKRYKLAIFDMDGTILDTLDDLTDAVNEMLRRYGYRERTREEIAAFLGNGSRRLFECALPDGVEREETDRILSDYGPYYLSHCDVKTRPYPGIKDLLDSLKKERVLSAVISNKPDAPVRRLADTFFPGAFSIVLGEDPGRPKKPAPDVLFAVMEKAGVSVDETVYIGDSEVDIETAANAGTDCISVSYGFRDERFLKERGASVIAHSAEELRSILLN